MPAEIPDRRARRLSYVAARINEAEKEVQRLRRIIDQQLDNQLPLAETVSQLIGEIDEIHCTLDRVRFVCRSLLAEDLLN